MMDWLNAITTLGWDSVMLYDPQFAFIEWIAAGASIISTVTGFLGSKKAERAAERQAAEEAKYDKMLTEESLRQLDVQQRVQYGEQMAQTVGGGVLARQPGLTQPGMTALSGSPLAVLAEREKELAAERSITERAGASRVAQTLQRGKATADYYKWSGYANVAAGISNLLTGGPGGKPMWGN